MRMTVSRWISGLPSGDAGDESYILVLKGGIDDHDITMDMQRALPMGAIGRMIPLL